MTGFFDTLYAVLGYPFGFVLRFIYNFIAFENYGLSLILFTLFARILMFPTTVIQQKSTVKTQRIQPKIRRINEKYKGDQQRIQQEMQNLYQREGYNPMSTGCMPLLIQLPIIYGLIGVIYHPLKYALLIDAEYITLLSEAAKTVMGDVSTQASRFVELYIIENIANLQGVAGVPESVYETIESFNFSFLGIKLGLTPSYKEFNALWAIPVLSFITSLASGLFTTMRQKKQNPEMSKNPAMGCMTLGMPIFSLILTFQFPAGIGIYWIASNVFSFITMIITHYTHNTRKLIAKDMVEETIQRRAKEKHIKAIAQVKNKNAEQ